MATTEDRYAPLRGAPAKTTTTQDEPAPTMWEEKGPSFVEHVTTAAAGRDDDIELAGDGPKRPTRHYGERVAPSGAGDMVSQNTDALNFVKARAENRTSAIANAEPDTFPSPSNEETSIEPPAPVSFDDLKVEHAEALTLEAAGDQPVQSSAEERAHADERTGRGAGELTEAQQVRLDKMIGRMAREAGNELTQHNNGSSRGGHSLGSD